MTEQPSRFLPVLMVVVAVTTIQFGASLSKQLFPMVGPEGATALRLFFASTILCAWWRPWRQRLSRRELTLVLVYGLAMGGMNMLIYRALSRIPLGIAVALEFLGPLAVALMGSRRWTDFVWIVLAISGVVALLPVTAASTGIDLVGVGFALGAGFCWFLYIIFGQKTGAAVHGGVATTLGMVVAACLAVPVGVIHAGTALFTWQVVPISLAVAMLSSVLPYSLEMSAMSKIPGKTFGILMSMEPAIAALFGLAVLGEHLRPIQIAGIACIMCASMGATLTTTRGIQQEAVS